MTFAVGAILGVKSKAEKLIEGLGLTGVHDESACRGRGCAIHHPSDHHMKDWPMLWRSDWRLLERTCEHGVGHPDPDHVAHTRALGGDWRSETVHGCDGCCRGAYGD